MINYNLAISHFQSQSLASLQDSFYLYLSLDLILLMALFDLLHRVFLDIFKIMEIGLLLYLNQLIKYITNLCIG